MKKAHTPYIKRPPSPSLSPRQQKALAIMREKFDGRTDFARQQLKLVAHDMGYTYHGPLRDILFALRDKGIMQSRGGPISKPTIWRLLPEPDASIPQHVHNYD